MSDKQRELFEEWAKEKYMLDKSKYGGYMAVSTKNAFDAWQAAIESVVVELPHTVYRGDYLQDGTSNLEWEEYYEIDEVKLSLDSAGIKCK